MYIIRGFRKKEGEYKGKAFCNYSLFCTLPDDDGVTGESVATIKVKPDVLSKAFPDGKTGVIGSHVEFSYKQVSFDGRVSAVVNGIKVLKKGVY